MEQFLTRLGYQVEAFQAAPAALARFESDPTAFALAIVDLSIPEISGAEIIVRLLERNARLRVLACTGLPFMLASLPAVARPRVEYLQKPFAPHMLAQAVQRLLEAPGQPPAAGNGTSPD